MSGNGGNARPQLASLRSTASGSIEAPSEPTLRVRDLTVTLNTARGSFPVVSRVSLDLFSGSMTGLVGESGSGKSVLCRSILGLLPQDFTIEQGQVLVEGRDMREMTTSELRALRAADIGFIPQEPMTALNPVLTIGKQLGETIKLHGVSSRRAVREEALRLLTAVRIADPIRCLASYPHENSGGMKQRILAAIALVGSPKILLADEPTTALDATAQLNFLRLLADLQSEIGCAVLFVTHNMKIVEKICDHIAVMYAGRLVEYGSTGVVSSRPRHPYTEALIASIPRLENRSEQLRTIEGSPPALFDQTAGCPFAPRCPHCMAQCTQSLPAPDIQRDGSISLCWLDRSSDQPTSVTP